MYNFQKNFTWKIKIRCRKGKIENKRALGNSTQTLTHIFNQEDKVKETSGKGEELENMRGKCDKEDPYAL